MRVLAATSSPEVQGLQTDADETIGVVSGQGSLFLILVVGIGAGLVGLALFATLRRWLPERSTHAGLIGVAIGAGVLVRPAGLITTDNDDFTLLQPVALAVMLVIGMIVLFGASFGVLVDRLAPRWPQPAWSLRGMLSLVPFAVLVLSPPLLLGVVVGVLFGVFAPAFSRAGAPSSRGPRRSDGTTTRIAKAAVLATGALGIVSVAVAAEQVLTI